MRLTIRLGTCISLGLALVRLSSCSPGAKSPAPPEALIASDRVVHVNVATGRILGQRLLPGHATDLALTPQGDGLAVATHHGAAFLTVPDLEVVWHDSLGIVDGVEFAPDGEHAYFLLHPGSDPQEASGDHVVREIVFPSGEYRREARLDVRSYDLFVERTSGGIYVSDLIGRTVHRIDPQTFAVTHHVIGLGRSPAEEPRGAFLRLLLPGPEGQIIVVEDSRDAARLWRWTPKILDAPSPLPGVDPPVLGGGILAAGAAGGGNTLWLHTRSHFLRLGADFSVTDRLALSATDSTAAFHFAAANPSTCVLLSPAPPLRGRPQAQAVWIDLERGTLAGKRLLALAAGPLVLLLPPPAAGAVAPTGR